MAEVTKACNLLQSEIEELLMYYGRIIGADIEGNIERINYLNKRLKAFKEPEETKTETATAPGWGVPPKE